MNKFAMNLFVKNIQFVVREILSLATAAAVEICLQDKSKDAGKYQIYFHDVLSIEDAWKNKVLMNILVVFIGSVHSCEWAGATLSPWGWLSDFFSMNSNKQLNISR